MSITPEETFAIVVGVERYKIGDNWKLPGPAKDAVKFCNWLKQRDIPDANVRLFLTPIDENDERALKGKLKIEKAELGPVTQFFENELPARQERMLIVYWGGHGLSDSEGDRMLLFADATEAVKRSLSLTRLRVFTASTANVGFELQVFIVDACGYYAEKQGYDSTIPSHEFPKYQVRDGVAQIGLLATASGQGAANLGESETGLYSEYLRKHLETETEWPCDFGGVHDAITTDFARLRADRKIAQAPQFSPWGAPSPWMVPRRGLFSRPASTVWENECDREVQAAQFSDRFRPHLERQRVPQTFFYYGHENEGHRSLMDRLLKKEVKRHAEGMWDIRGGAAVLDIAGLDWPQPSLPYESQRGTLRNLLMKELDPSGKKNPEKIVDVLSAERFQQYKVIVIPHFIAIGKWSPSFAETLKWYLDEYWGAYRADDPLPRAILLMSLLLKGALQPSGFKLPFVNTHGMFLKQLAAFGSRAADDTSRVTLDELGPVSRDDVRNWFNIRTDLGNEGVRVQLADQVFDAAEMRVRDLRRYLSVQQALKILERVHLVRNQRT